jgi:hypothetical protein
MSYLFKTARGDEDDDSKSPELTDFSKTPYISHLSKQERAFEAFLTNTK